MENYSTDENCQEHKHPADGIEGIAVRIHERAVQLSNEQEELRVAEQELQDLKEKMESEKEKNQVVRAKYLQHMTKQNAIEMECIQMEASIKERIDKTDSMKKEEEDILACLTIKNEEWIFTEDALARHTLRQELFLKVLQGVIDERKQAVSRRNSRLESAQKLSDELKHKEILNVQKQDQIQLETKHIANAEEQENKAIDALASRVRDTLAKVRNETCRTRMSRIV